MRLGRPPSRSILVLLTAQSVIASLFGLRLISEWGSDFGVYFVGAHAISDDYGLYTGFFDHKGPLFYTFLRATSLVIPYSVAGACLALSLCAVFWFACIWIAALLMRTSVRAMVLMGWAGGAALVLQPSNASIAIFQGGLVIIALASVWRFRCTGTSMYIFWAFFGLGAAIQVRVDAVLFFPLLMILMSSGSLVRKRSRQLTYVFGSLGLALIVFCILLFGQTLYLRFRLQDYWQNAVVFNATDYRQLGLAERISFLDHIRGLLPFQLFQILLISGILAVVLIFLCLSPRGAAVSDIRLVVFALAYSTFILILTQSDKNYHLFILLPALIWGLGVLAETVPSNPQLLTSLTMPLVLAATFTIFSLGKEAVCAVYGSCPNRFADVVDFTSDIGPPPAFLMNQGWPYLLLGIKPQINFTPLWVIQFGSDDEFDRLNEEIMSLGETDIWLETNQVPYGQFGTDKRYEKLLKDRYSTELGQWSVWQSRALSATYSP